MARLGTVLISLGVVLSAMVDVCVAQESQTEGEAHVKVQLRGYGDRVDIVRQAEDRYVFRLHADDGSVQSLTAVEFADRVYREQSRQSWWNRLLNVTSPIGIAWVALGFLGQLLFTGRMLVQWLVSERRRRSVVPPAFWWMSLGGASMLLVYFVWRRDIVGVVGQTTGWMIYLRNLWFIYRGGGGRGAGEDRPEVVPAQS